MLRHINAARLLLLLRIWWFERTNMILEDQQARVQVALRENDLMLQELYARLRATLPEVNHG